MTKVYVIEDGTTFIEDKEFKIIGYVVNDEVTTRLVEIGFETPILSIINLILNDQSLPSKLEIIVADEYVIDALDEKAKPEDKEVVREILDKKKNAKYFFFPKDGWGTDFDNIENIIQEEGEKQAEDIRNFESDFTSFKQYRDELIKIPHTERQGNNLFILSGKIIRELIDIGNSKFEEWRNKKMQRSDLEYMNNEYNAITSLNTLTGKITPQLRNYQQNLAKLRSSFKFLQVYSPLQQEISKPKTITAVKKKEKELYSESRSFISEVLKPNASKESLIKTKVSKFIIPEEEINNVITPDDVLTEIKNVSKLEQIRKSLIEIIEWKLERYNDIRENFINEKEQIEEQINEMKLDIHQIDISFPQYRSIVTGLHSIKTIIKQLETNLKTYRDSKSKETIKNSFIAGITDPRRGLAALEGDSRESIRNFIADQLFSLTRGSQVFIDNFLNVVIMGGAGVGKTLAAKVLSFVLSICGVMATDNVKVVTRADLVGQHIGETAIKTRSQLLLTLEGILFIDEAYQISTPNEGKDFGKEAITEIVNFSDKYIGLSRIFAAGYEAPVKKNFLGSNEGMPRRFPFQIVLPNYSLDDLYRILYKNINNKFPGILSQDDVDLIYLILKELNEQNVFNNQAGDMANLTTFLALRINGGKTPWGGPSNKFKILSTFNYFLENKQLDLRLELESLS